MFVMSSPKQNLHDFAYVINYWFFFKVNLNATFRQGTEQSMNNECKTMATRPMQNTLLSQIPFFSFSLYYPLLHLKPSVKFFETKMKMGYHLFRRAHKKKLQLC